MGSRTTECQTTAPDLHLPITKGVANRDIKEIEAEFTYYKDPGDGKPPHQAFIDRPETFARPAETVTKIVRNIRGDEDQYTLDKTGFQAVKHTSQEKDFLDEERIKSVYYPEIEELMKKVYVATLNPSNAYPADVPSTGATRIVIWDITIRRQSDDSKAPHAQSRENRGPVRRVHIDQSYDAGPERVQYELPEEAAQLMRSRFQIINAWRPIKTVRKDPLGVCDARSVAEDDLVAVQLVFPDRIGETFAVKANEMHRWYHLREQTPDEVMLIKCFDSETNGRARRTPHSAFVDKGMLGEADRESIEVRALVFHGNDDGR